MHRSIMPLAVLMAASFALGAEARAQAPAGSQKTEEEPGGASQSAITPEPEAPDVDPDAEVWSRYHQADADLRHGQKIEALRALEAIVKEHPDSPAAAAARVLIKRERKAAHEEPLLKVRGGVLDTSTKSESARSDSEKPAGRAEVSADRDLGHQLRDEQPSGLARAELAAGQTLGGLVLGGATCALLQCNDVRVGVFSLMLGGSAGLTLSLLATSDGITPGHAAILNTGSEWGFWNGLGLALGSAKDPGASAVAGALIIGQLSGLGAGEIAYRSFHPSAGDVSFASSGGIWSVVLFNLIAGAGKADISDQTRLLLSLGVSDLGLLGGALVASRYPMSRGRALLIDVGGGVGLLMGVGGAILIGGDKADSGAILGLGAAGTAVGLALTGFLTRNWDLPDVPVQVALAPTQGGAQVMVGFSL